MIKWTNLTKILHMPGGSDVKTLDSVSLSVEFSLLVFTRSTDLALSLANCESTLPEPLRAEE